MVLEMLDTELLSRSFEIITLSMSQPFLFVYLANSFSGFSFSSLLSSVSNERKQQQPGFPR